MKKTTASPNTMRNNILNNRERKKIKENNN